MCRRSTGREAREYADGNSRGTDLVVLREADNQSNPTGRSKKKKTHRGRQETAQKRAKCV